jgi:ribosome-associated protein
MPRKPSLSKKKNVIIDALEDIKARDIIAIDVARLTSVFDWVVIATAESARQTKALARHVQDAIRELGEKVIGIEGEETGDWVLVDSGDIVVHIMQPQTRDYYNLEELWNQGKVERVGPVKKIATMEDPILPAGVVVKRVRAKPAAETNEESVPTKAPAKKVVTRTAKQALADESEGQTKPRAKSRTKTPAKSVAKSAATPVAKKAVRKRAATVDDAAPAPKTTRRRKPATE